MKMAEYRMEGRRGIGQFSYGPEKNEIISTGVRMCVCTPNEM